MPKIVNILTMNCLSCLLPELFPTRPREGALHGKFCGTLEVLHKPQLPLNVQGRPGSHKQPVMTVQLIASPDRCLNFDSGIRFTPLVVLTNELLGCARHHFGAVLCAAACLLSSSKKGVNKFWLYAFIL